RFVGIALGFDPAIAQPVIGSHGGPRLNVFKDKGLKFRGRSGTPLPQTNAAELASPHAFNRRHDQGLGSKPPPAFARLRRSQIAFIHFDQALQSFPSRSHHRPAQLVQQAPGGAVTPQAEHPLQPQRAGTVLLSDNVPDRAKPKRQGQIAIAKDRAGGHGGLALAITADPKRPGGSPRTRRVAFWTAKSLRPAQPG